METLIFKIPLMSCFSKTLEIIEENAKNNQTN